MKSMAVACFTPASQAELGMLEHSLKKSGDNTDAEIDAMLQHGKVKRYLPDREVIAAHVTQVMLDYTDVVDTVNQLPLLTTAVWDQFFRNLSKVQEGLLSGQIIAPVNTVLYLCLCLMCCLQIFSRKSLFRP